MERKVCTNCNIEKNIENFYNKFSECKDCNSDRSVQCYHENKYKKSNQRKLYYEKMK